MGADKLISLIKEKLKAYLLPEVQAGAAISLKVALGAQHYVRA